MGATVWVGASGANAVSTFKAASDGKLAFSACVSDTGSSGLCTDLPGLPITGPGSIAVSPNGSSVYVGANTRSSVSHFFVGRQRQPRLRRVRIRRRERTMHQRARRAA